MFRLVAKITHCQTQQKFSKIDGNVIFIYTVHKSIKITVNVTCYLLIVQNIEVPVLCKLHVRISSCQYIDVYSNWSFYGVSLCFAFAKVFINNTILAFFWFKTKSVFVFQVRGSKSSLTPFSGFKSPALDILSGIWKKNIQNGLWIIREMLSFKYGTSPYCDVHVNSIEINNKKSILL